VTGGDRKGVRSVAAGVLWAAPLFALWLALTDNTRPLEMLVGGGCALVAGAAAASAGLLSRVRFRPRLRWLLRVAALPWWVVKDSFLVFRALLRRPPQRGTFTAYRSPAAGEGDRALARRVMAFGPGSAGPNAYAVGVEEQAGVILVHQLVPEERPAPVRLAEEP
jgi:hypothetical protein